MGLASARSGVQPASGTCGDPWVVHDEPVVAVLEHGAEAVVMADVVVVAFVQPRVRLFEALDGEVGANPGGKRAPRFADVESSRATGSAFVTTDDSKIDVGAFGEIRSTDVIDQPGVTGSRHQIARSSERIAAVDVLPSEASVIV